MWTCKQCNGENNDRAALCAHCGAARAAGRFDPPAGRREKVFRQARPAYQTPDTGLGNRKRRPRALSAAARIIGILLMALLPLWVLALAVTQYGALSGALVPLFLAPEAPAWLGAALYGLMTLTAVLLSLLPGLWTKMLGNESR